MRIIHLHPSQYKNDTHSSDISSYQPDSSSSLTNSADVRVPSAAHSFQLTRERNTPVPGLYLVRQCSICCNRAIATVPTAAGHIAEKTCWSLRAMWGAYNLVV